MKLNIKIKTLLKTVTASSCLITFSNVAFADAKHFECNLIEIELNSFNKVLSSVSLRK